MAVTINATTTQGLLVTPDNSGLLQFQLNGVNLPQPTVMPCFSVTRSADQSVTQNTYTRVNWDVKNFDTNNNFDASTNYRYTPTVAGYYIFHCGFFNNPGGAGQFVTAVRKNGGNQSPVGNLVIGGTAVGGGTMVSTTVLLFANGSTDYFDTAIYASTASPTIQASSTFYGYFVRGV
jgi:hypothetical protein